MKKTQKIVKIHGFEPGLTKKNAKIGNKATKKGLKPLFFWYQTYAFNMALITHNDTCLNTLSDIFEYL